MGYLNFTDALTQAKRNSILTGRPFSMGDYNNLQSAYMSGATARANAARSQALSEKSLSNQQANWASQLAQQKELSAAQIAAQEKAMKRSSSNNLINAGVNMVGSDLLLNKGSGLKGIYNAVTSPVETAKSIYDAGLGAYNQITGNVPELINAGGGMGVDVGTGNLINLPGATPAPATLAPAGNTPFAPDATSFYEGLNSTPYAAADTSVMSSGVPASLELGGGAAGGAMAGGAMGASTLTNMGGGMGIDSATGMMVNMPGSTSGGVAAAGASPFGMASGGLGAAGIGAATPGILNAMKSNATREIGKGATLGLVSDKRLSSAIGGGLSGAATGALAGHFLIPVPGLGAAIGAVLGGLGGGIMEGISGFGGAKQHGYASPELMSSRVAKDYPEYYDQSRNADNMMPYRTPYEQYVERYSNIMNQNPNVMKHLTQWTPEQLGTYNQAGLMNEKDWYSTYMPGYSAANYPKLVPYYPDRM